MNRIRIGQIGICHEHAAAKMDSLRAMPDTYEIVGVVDDRHSTAAKFLKDDESTYQGLTWMTEDQLLATPGLQAVTVETPNLDLVPTAMRCMERGLAIHMDKPGGDDLGLFRELLDGCQARKLPFQMGYMLRNNPAIQFCQKVVRDGWLGEVFEVQANISHDYGGDEYQDYLGKIKGGIMFNLGCHLIDLIVSLLGKPDGVTPFPKSTAGIDPAINNNGLAVLNYPHATVALRSCSKTVDGINQRRLTINGTQGTFDLYPLEVHDGNPFQAQLILAEDTAEFPAGQHTVTFAGSTDRYQSQLQELARIIHGEIANPYTYEHDLLTQEVVLAASGHDAWRAR